MTTPSGPRDSVVKVRPVEAVGDALAQSFREVVAEVSGDSWEETGVTLPSRKVWDRYAAAVLTRLRELGAFNIEFLEAIKRESRE